MWQLAWDQSVGCNGKSVWKVIQGRLQVVVEDTLPDSQCGFRCG